jgi:hypothetical protein
MTTAYFGYSALQGTDLGNTLATLGSKAKSQAVTAKGFLFGTPYKSGGPPPVKYGSKTKGLLGSYGFKDFGKSILGNIQDRATARLTQGGTQAEKLQARSAQIDPRISISPTGASYAAGKTTVPGATDIRIQTALAQLVGSKNLAQILAGEIPANFVEPSGSAGATIKIGSSKLSDLEIT